MSAWAEFCEWRRLAGLPQIRHDEDMTLFAQGKARWQAERGLDGGHDGPGCPSGWREGTAKAAKSWGWLTCCQEEDAAYGGAGMCVGRDGERHMVLVLRGGTGRPLIPRRRIPVFKTAHLSPNPPSVSEVWRPYRWGNPFRFK